MKNFGPSVTSIGLLKDGAPYLGVIYNPWTDQMFAAVKGEGAFENGKLIYSSEDPLDLSLMTFGTAPYYPELHKLAFETGLMYEKYCIDIRRTGCAEWDLCMVASGRPWYVRRAYRSALGLRCGCYNP